MPTREQLIDRARSARAAGRHAEAAAAWRDAIDLCPDEAVLYHNWAAALGDLRRHAEAAAALEAGFTKGLNAYQSYLVLARAKAGLLRHEEATRAYRRYLDSAPADVTAQIEHAQLLWMQTADAGHALETLDAAIRRLPAPVDLVIARCRLVGEMGDRDAAYAGLRAAMARYGPTAEALGAASAAALACGNAAAAVDHAVQLVAIHPSDAAALVAHAMALIAVGSYASAQETIDRLRTVNPLNQYHVALQGDLWRLTGSERQRDLYDYDRLIFRAPLEAPPGWPSAEAYVDDLVEALQTRHEYQAEPFFQSVRHGSQISSLASFDDPALQGFSAAVTPGARRFAEHLSSMSGPAGARSSGKANLVGAWSVQLPAGGFHADHIHPEGWISSACHLLCSNPGEGERSGWLKFGQSALPTSPQLTAEYFVEPSPGVVVFFPSYFWHGTVPTNGGSRLTVAADFVPT
ncbi:putative 2OG-Fe(II) oxygenase [Sphingoaurantiacus capsulatus]|uniref:2OG-Fe(II) oxygenase n=1 Tax=Sphingoaurantiacus capsulatus TaxID=1771310 RepID=A0ABV7XCF4_9SPHN